MLANALLTTPEKPSRVMTKLGIPIFSDLAATRPAAVEQPPQPALPVMTAWHPFAFIKLVILSTSMEVVPMGNSV